jgi:putative serine protease PepD
MAQPVATLGLRKQRPVALIAMTAVVAGLVGGGVATATARLASAPSATASTASPSARAASSAADGTVESVAKAVLPSTVQIQMRSTDGSGDTGSGSIISADGYILTNNHVVAGAAQGGALTVLFNDGSKASAKLVGRDAGDDIAVIKADGVSGLTAIRIGSAADLQVGQSVVALGSPLALAGTVTEGIVSALDRPVSTAGDGSTTSVMNAIQTDTAINPGNSGGPLVNLRGELVGMNSAGASLGSNGQETGSIGLGFAIPVDQAMRVANQLIKDGHATRAFLGASAADAEGGGATLQDVQSGSAAAKAGLADGDTITKVDGRTIADGEALVATIRSAPAGSTVELTYVRDGSSHTVRVTLGSVAV